MPVFQKCVFLHRGMLVAHLDSHDQNTLQAEDALPDLGIHTKDYLFILQHDTTFNADMQTNTQQR